MNQSKSMKMIMLILVTFLAFFLVPSPIISGGDDVLKIENAITDLTSQLRASLSNTQFRHIGIAEFGPTGGASIKLGPYLSDKLTAGIAQGGSVEIIERSKLDLIIGEQRLGQTGMVDEKSAQQVGKLLGIHAFVLGNYTVVGKYVDVNARLVDAGTGKVVSVSSVKIKKDDDIAELFEPLVPATPLQLESALLVQRKTDKGYDGVMVKEGDTLYTNDNFKLFIRTNEDCYIYALMFSSNGKVEKIFPLESINMSNRIQGKQDYFVPLGSDWYFLDENTGTETIFIIASYEPMRDIDKLLMDMENASAEAQAEEARKAEENLNVGTRGVGGVRPGAKVTTTTSDGKKIEKVSEVVTGKVKVVRKISFQHR